MPSFKFPRTIAWAFVGPHGVAGNVFLVCCGLITAFISMPTWSRWISEHFSLHGPRPQVGADDENTPDCQARSSIDEDNTLLGDGDVTSEEGDVTSEEGDASSENGDQARCLACPPPAEYPIEILYDDGNATIEYVSAPV